MSGIAEALTLVSALIDLLQVLQRMAPSLSAEIQAVTGLVRQAQADKRDLSHAEMQAVRAIVDGARARAAAAIEAAP